MFVTDIMTRQVKTVGPDCSLQQLTEIFESVSFRHLLVEQEGRLVGVISDRDVMAHVSPFLSTELERERDKVQMQSSASQIMAENPITVDCETLIDSASIVLIENNISCLPVVYEDQTIAGVLSWKDILQYHVYGVDKTLAT